MKKLFSILCFGLLLSGCMKDVAYDNPLALSAKRNELSAKGGSTPVIVFANGQWTASLPENCDWASLEKSEGSGLGEFIFNFSENSGAARKVTVTVRSAGHVSRIEMAQKSGLDVLSLTFPYSTFKVSRLSGRATAPFTSNIPESEMQKVKVSATEQNGSAADWIRNLTVFSDRLCFDLEENTGTESRKATIAFRYVDDFGEELSRNITVEQTCSAAYVNFDRTVVSSMFSAMPTKVRLPFTTNLGLFLPQLLGNAVSNQDWAVIEKGAGLTQELIVNLSANEGADRIAKISMSYTGDAGETSDFSCLVVQKAHVETISMETLKASVTEIDYTPNWI